MSSSTTVQTSAPFIMTIPGTAQNNHQHVNGNGGPQGNQNINLITAPIVVDFSNLTVCLPPPSYDKENNCGDK